MACFADINVSQGSRAAQARRGVTFNVYLTTNLPRKLPVNFFKNRLRFDRIMVVSKNSFIPRIIFYFFCNC